MRASLFLGLLAFTLTATACSGAPEPGPSPSLSIDNTILNVTDPSTPFDAAIARALGPNGEALVVFTHDVTLWDDGFDSGEWGIALVERDGGYSILVDPEDSLVGEGTVYDAAVSSTMVAFTISDYDGNPALYFWDRSSHALIPGPTSITDGYGLGENLYPGGDNLALSGNSVLWTQQVGGGWDYMVVQASTDGTAETILNWSPSWYEVGVDWCHSDEADTTLWAVHTTDDTSSDPASATAVTLSYRFVLENGSPELLVENPIVRRKNEDGYYFYNSTRCGDEILHAWRAPNDRDISAGLTVGDDPTVSVVIPGSKEFDMIDEMYLSEDWLIVTMSNGWRPETTLMHRPTEQTLAFPAAHYCGTATIRGDFILWGSPPDSIEPSSSLDNPADCHPYVGVLNPPE